MGKSLASLDQKKCRMRKAKKRPPAARMRNGDEHSGAAGVARHRSAEAVSMYFEADPAPEKFSHAMMCVTPLQGTLSCGASVYYPHGCGTCFVDLYGSVSDLGGDIPVAQAIADGVISVSCYDLNTLEIHNERPYDVDINVKACCMEPVPDGP